MRGFFTLLFSLFKSRPISPEIPVEGLKEFLNIVHRNRGGIVQITDTYEPRHTCSYPPSEKGEDEPVYPYLKFTYTDRRGQRFAHQYPAPYDDPKTHRVWAASLHPQKWVNELNANPKLAGMTFTFTRNISTDI